MNGWANGLNNAASEIASWIPQIVQVVIILIIGYFIAIVIKKVIVALLDRFRLNQRLREKNEYSLFRRITKNPSEMIGGIVYWLIWILVLTIAIPILNIPVLNQLIFGFYAYLPNILAAIIILIAATLISAGVAALASRLMGDTPTGKIVSTVIPALIMTIATFMVLVQLHIATQIVVITYAAILGSLGLGFALSFGLGGRDVAGRILENAYKKGQDNIDQAKRDLETAKNRGQKEAENIKERYQ